MTGDKKSLPKLGELGAATPMGLRRIKEALKSLYSRSLSEDEKDRIIELLGILGEANSSLYEIIDARCPPGEALLVSNYLSMIMEICAFVGSYAPPADGVIRQIERNRTSLARAKRSSKVEKRRALVKEIAPDFVGSSDMPAAVRAALADRIGEDKTPNVRTIRADLEALGFLKF